jgi:hypothetical protein
MRRSPEEIALDRAAYAQPIDQRANVIPSVARPFAGLRFGTPAEPIAPRHRGRIVLLPCGCRLWVPAGRAVGDCPMCGAFRGASR